MVFARRLDSYLPVTSFAEPAGLHTEPAGFVFSRSQRCRDPAALHEVIMNRRLSVLHVIEDIFTGGQVAVLLVLVMARLLHATPR